MDNRVSPDAHLLLYSSASARITGQGRTGTLHYKSRDLSRYDTPAVDARDDHRGERLARRAVRDEKKDAPITPPNFMTLDGTLYVDNDSGHGMLFRSFDGKLMLVIHQPFQNARGKIYQMVDTRDNLQVVRFREDLSGPPLPPLPGQAPRQ